MEIASLLISVASLIVSIIGLIVAIGPPPGRGRHRR